MSSVSLRKAAGKITTAVFLAVAVLLVVPHLVSAQVDSVQEKSSASVDGFLKGDINFSTVDALCNRSILANRPVSKLVKQFQSIAQDESKAAGERSKAFLVVSFMQWRLGDLEAATKSAEAGIKVQQSGQLLVQLAKLQDASGKFEKALKQYQKAIPHLKGAELEKIQVRVTLLQSKGNVKPLIELAKTKGDEFRNRAAVALAILGHEKEATELFVVDSNSKQSNQFRQKIRLAEWSIRAKEVKAAKEHAWQSVGLAKLKRDRRYGLALLVEAHRMDDSISKLIEKLKSKKPLTEDESYVLVELFRETKKYDEAITVFKESSGTWTPLLKRQLIGLYRESGRNEDIEREFSSLISLEPKDVSWPKGLAEHFLERGQKKKARQIWEAYIERNSRSGDLIAAAESMAQLGLDDLAIKAAKKSRTNERTYAIGALFLFELYLSRGLQEDATAILDDLNKQLPVKSLSRRDLADGFERLSQPKKALEVWKGLYDNGVELGVDGEMRIAWLQQSVGKNEEALVSWYAMLEKTPATQRRLVEDRILTLSAQLGRLGKTAVALEEKILNKTADEKDARMLIKIYTKAGDAGSAVEIIEEFFGDGSSESENIVMLREKANIFRFLGEYKDYEKVTKQLVKVDTKHRLEHLRSLILNHIENTTVNSHDPKENNSNRSRELKELIVEHNKYGDGESAREFEAGVLDLAGDKEKAIEVYRKALAENPNRGDNYLVMANLMKSTEQTREAVRMFQFLAERTDRDDLFVIAMDGLLNMQDPDSSILQWGKRITLERLTRKSDKSYLYSLLADLADDSRDVNTQIAALESSLSHANSRRATTLRELIVLTDPNSRMGGRPKKPNVQENLKYSRRLIALRQAFPPEVFVNMGKAFLSVGEPANAQKAFTMAVDSTGRADLMVEAARQFEERSYTKEALAQYEKSLIANKGDLEILWRLGQLKEQAGWNDAANQLYHDALKGILSRHPIHVESNRLAEPVYVNSALDIPSDVRQDPSKTDEYKRHYFVLRDGFIRTLPEDAALRSKALGWFLSAYQKELQKLTGVEPKSIGRMVNYPRLNVLSQFLRYVALSSGNCRQADQFDQALLSVFHADSGLVKTLVEQRREWGQADFAQALSAYKGVPEDVKANVASLWKPSSATDSSALAQRFVRIKTGKSRTIWSFRGVSGKAAELERQLSVAVLTKDQNVILETCKQLSKENMFDRAVLHGKNLLDQAHFKLLCQYIVRRVKGNKSRVAAVLGAARNNFGLRQEEKRASWLDVVESTSGETIVSYEDMITYVENAKYLYQLNFDYLLKHLNGRQRLRFLKALNNPSKVKQSKAMKLLVLKSMLRIVLEQPCEKAEQDVWLKLLKENVEKNDQIRRAQNLQFFNNLKFHSQNSSFVEAIATTLDSSGKLAKPGSVFAVQMAVAKKEPQQALSQWIQCYLKGEFLPNFNNPASRQSMFRYYSDQFIESTFDDVLKGRRAEFAKLLAERDLSAAEKKRILELQLKLLPYYEADEPGSTPEILRQLAAAHPKNQNIYRQLLTHYRSQGDIVRAIELNLTRSKSNPSDKGIQQQLYQDWLAVGNPVKALALKPKRQPVTPAGKRPRVRPKRRPTIIRGRTSPQTDLRKAVATGDEKKIQAIVRKMWQSVAVTLGQIEYSPGQSFTRMELGSFVNMKWPEAPVKNAKESGKQKNAPGTTKVPSKKPRTLCEGLTDYSFSVAEMKGWVRALRADEVDNAYPVFKGLAQAIVRHGDAVKERDRLTQAIFENRQGDKGVALWLALLEAKAELADQAHLDKIQQLIGRGVPLRRSQTLAIAHIYCRAGQMDEATRMYRSALCALVNRNLEYQNDRNRPTVLALVEEAKENLSAESYQQFLTEVFQLTQPAFGQGLEEAYAEFGMKLLPEAAGDADFEKLYGRWVKENLVRGDSWASAQAIKAAMFLKKAGASSEALIVLRQALKKQPPAKRQVGINFGVGYKQMLGIDRWGQPRYLFGGRGAPSSPTTIYAPLFPKKESADQSEWSRLVAGKLADWISDPKLDPGKVLSLSELVLKNSGKSAGQVKASVFKAVTNYLKSSAHISAVQANRWISLANQSGQPIDLEICQNLAKDNLLRSEQLESVLKRTAAKQGPAAVLEIGGVTSKYCQSEQCLSQMVAAAKAAGGGELLAKYQGMLSESMKAKDLLRPKKPKMKKGGPRKSAPVKSS